MAELSVKLAIPSDVAAVFNAPRVQLPALAGDITILPDRAPLELVLRNGLVRIYDEKGQAGDGYFIKGGIAHIAGNECQVGTEMIVPMKDISLAEAEHKSADQALNIEEQKFFGDVAAKLKLLNR